MAKTIEEKAKAYDKALKVAQRFYNNSVAITKKGLEDIFPELKENEDERIRKAIIDVLKAVYECADTPFISQKQTLDSYVAWLEKQGEKAKYHDICDKCVRQPTCQSDCFLQQGEQKPADLKTKAGNWYTCDMEVMNENMVTAFHRDEIYYCPKDGYLDVGGALFEVGCLDVFRLATEKEIPQPKQGEQKSIESTKTKLNESMIKPDPNPYWTLAPEYKLMNEQKPAWSEEDEERLSDAIFFVREYQIPTRDKRLLNAAKEAEEWLKSLEERVQPQPKQEWNEDDEYMLYGVIETEQYMLDVVNGIKEFDVGNEEIRKACTEELNWLRTLRPQSHWSEEQLLEGLNEAANEWDSKASFSPFYMVMDGDRPTDVRQDITSHGDSFKAGVEWVINKLKAI